MARTRTAAGLAALLLCATLLSPAGTAMGEEPAPARIRVRTGVHHGFTRIVFDWPQAVGYEVLQHGDQAELRFARPATLDTAALRRPLRNLRASEATAEGMRITLRPGVAVRHLVVGTLVVLDLMDPPRQATRAPTPPDSPPAPPPPPSPTHSPTPAPAAAPLPTPAATPPTTPPPPPAGAAETDLRLPFTGPAAGLLGGDGLLVMVEDDRPRNLAALRRANPALAGAELVELPGATALRLPSPRSAALNRDPAAWLQPPPEPAAPLGFAVEPTRHGVAVSLLPEAQPAAPAPPLLALQDLPEATLLARWRALPGRIAATPEAEREASRMELAETLLGLGLGAEAQSALYLATGDDPRLVLQPRALLLAGATAVLAGRPEEAQAPLDDPRLPATEEVALWRALARPEIESPFRAAIPLLLRYPAPLRARLLPGLAATLAEAGATTEAQALLAGDPVAAGLPLARYAAAVMQEAAGATEPALASYAGLAKDRDRDARARALGRLAELRLASGAIDAAAAAQALEAAVPAWRGDGRELARRLRAADLYLQAAQPAAALALLRDTGASFPDAAEALRPRLVTATIAMLDDPQASPLEMARLHAEQHATLPPDARLDAAVARIADRLMGLELPHEAGALLARAVPTSIDGGALSVRLAEARLADGDAEGALQALRRGAALPGEMGRRRALAEAAARRESGDLPGAIGVLRGLGAEGAAPLAELLAAAQDWPGAAASLQRHLDRQAPGNAPLDEAARRDLLRLAAFLALAQDRAGLAALQQRYGDRVQEGGFAEAFAAVASGTPGTLDLPRLRQEIAETRALQEQLRALR